MPFPKRQGASLVFRNARNARFLVCFSENVHSPHLPHHYSDNTVAYTGTHDNNTTLGALYEISNLERKRVADYPCTDPCNIKQLTKAAVFAVFRSKAPLATVPLWDILGYCKDTRKNTLATSVANWAYRVAEWQLNEIDTCEQRYVNTIF